MNQQERDEMEFDKEWFKNFSGKGDAFREAMAKQNPEYQRRKDWYMMGLLAERARQALKEIGDET